MKKLLKQVQTPAVAESTSATAYQNKGTSEYKSNFQKNVTDENSASGLFFDKSTSSFLFKQATSQCQKPPTTV